MIKFKVGDIVKLKAQTRDFGAKNGATAIIKEIQGSLLILEWIRENTLCGAQKDGDYEAEDFILVKHLKQDIKLYGICNFVNTYYK